jgi:hypothetical protein
MSKLIGQDDYVWLIPISRDDWIIEVRILKSLLCIVVNIDKSSIAYLYVNVGTTFPKVGKNVTGWISSMT